MLCFSSLRLKDLGLDVVKCAWEQVDVSPPVSAKKHFLLSDLSLVKKS